MDDCDGDVNSEDDVVSEEEEEDDDDHDHDDDDDHDCIELI